MKVYAYEKCSTCVKALAYLKSTGRAFEVLPIRQQPPTKAELRTMLKIYGGKLARLFNTSGSDYRELGLGEKMKTMREDEALDLLSKNGNLVKRPFVLAGNTGAVGFNLDEWRDKGLRPLPKV
ncbi:MAG TPA: arsenate reductase family protein [bacterium]|jgi:arsenate reductase|nr:arsenate reductase family protein [bacterium]